MDLAVLHCLNTGKTAIGEQFRVGVAHFYILIILIKSYLSEIFYANAFSVPGQ